jgi:uncharacterized membrane protein YhaH (DUF805 family)
MLKSLFGFQGRLRRSSYFLYGLLFILVPYLAVSFAVLAMIAGRYDDGSLLSIEVNRIEEVVALSVLSVGLVVIPTWSFFAMSVKRLHDFGQSGLFSLLVLLPGIGAPLIYAVLSLVPGQAGANRYGPDPRRA